MTPEEHGQRIAYAGADATRNAVSALEQAKREFEQQRNVLAHWVAGARTANAQGWWIFGVLVVSFALGIAGGIGIAMVPW
ncbi:MAG: hypothetical protein KDA37_14255 [Planctomycetales bacterium]|nr:hypothetical protein [Planctomycetales bacterium]